VAYLVRVASQCPGQEFGHGENLRVLLGGEDNPTLLRSSRGDDYLLQRTTHL
jgi:hypothetical protein